MLRLSGKGIQYDVALFWASHLHCFHYPAASIPCRHTYQTWTLALLCSPRPQEASTRQRCRLDQDQSVPMELGGSLGPVWLANSSRCDAKCLKAPRNVVAVESEDFSASSADQWLLIRYHPQITARRSTPCAKQLASYSRQWTAYSSRTICPRMMHVAKHPQWAVHLLLQRAIRFIRKDRSTSQGWP